MDERDDLRAMQEQLQRIAAQITELMHTVQRLREELQLRQNACTKRDGAD